MKRRQQLLTAMWSDSVAAWSYGIAVGKTKQVLGPCILLFPQIILMGCLWWEPYAGATIFNNVSG